MNNDIPLFEELAKLRGATVTVWEYIVTHQILALRFQHTARSGYAYLVCQGCRRIEVSTHWLDSSFEVLDTDPGWILLVDQGAPARIECLAAAVSHNVVPNFRRDRSPPSSS